MDNALEIIRSNLSKRELLCQLAEEAAELSQAALKLVRAIGGNNPTPVTKQQAENNLAEEVIDVSVCLSVLGLLSVDPDDDGRYEEKIQRWASRIAELFGE